MEGCHVGVQLPFDDGGIAVAALRGLMGFLVVVEKWSGTWVCGRVGGTVGTLVVVGAPEGVLYALKGCFELGFAVSACTVLL